MITALQLTASALNLWSKTKFYGKKIWLWMKSNGHIVFVVALAVIAAIVARKPPNLGKILSVKKDSYDAEIKAIQGAHEKELADRDKALKRYDSALKQIEDQHSEDAQKLDAKKKKKVRDLIVENADDPDAITQRIAELTGFTVVDMD
jgi:Skp family chaperone for outer membrane proteins